MSIFVGNLPFRAEREDVLQLFSPFGEVVNCSLPLERDTGRKRGFAFVEMADQEIESTAIERLQGSEMMGRPLRINKAEPRGGGAPRRNYGNNNTRQDNNHSNYGGGPSVNNNFDYGSGSSNANSGYSGGYSSSNNSGRYNESNSNYGNRTSGAKGWEDRSYGNNIENSEYENGRSRRRRGGAGNAERDSGAEA